MSEFRKDGGGDFDKRGGATPPSSGSGASGIDPFGFKHEVQAALRAEHRPSPEVMDLIQRWRIPEHVVRAGRLMLRAISQNTTRCLHFTATSNLWRTEMQRRIFMFIRPFLEVHDSDFHQRGAQSWLMFRFRWRISPAGDVH